MLVVSGVAICRFRFLKTIDQEIIELYINIICFINVGLAMYFAGVSLILREYSNRDTP